MPGVAAFQFGVDGVEDLPFFQRPQRRKEAVAGAVAGETVNDRCRVETFKDIAGEGDVSILIEDRYLAALVGSAEFGVAEDMEEVELDPVEAEARHLLGGGEDLGVTFAGEAEDEMGADPQAALPRPCQSVKEAAIIVTAPQSLQGGVVARLHAYFQPEIGAAGVAGEEIEDIVREAIRPGTNGEADNAVNAEGFVVKAAQFCDRRIGVGEGLKIGDEMLRFLLALHDLFADVQLGGDTEAMVEADRSRAAGVAEDAAALLPSTVAIGAAETGIDGDFVHPKAELLLELIRIEVITLCFHGETMPRKGKGGQILRKD